MFMCDQNTQKNMPCNDTRLTVAFYDLLISKGLFFNLAQKPRFKKVLDLARNVSKSYQPPNRKLIQKELLDFIHEQMMESNLCLIEKESDLFGLLFLGDVGTISRIPLLKILVSRKIFQQLNQNLLIAAATYHMVRKKVELFYVLDLLIT